MEEKLKIFSRAFLKRLTESYAKPTQTSVGGGVEELARGLKIRIIKIIICWFRKMMKIKFFYPLPNGNKIHRKEEKKFAFFGQSIKL